MFRPASSPQDNRCHTSATPPAADRPAPDGSPAPVRCTHAPSHAPTASPPSPGSPPSAVRPSGGLYRHSRSGPPHGGLH
ncbi:hypothetical protein AWP64_25645, partial [Escherichia coli]